MRIIVDIDAILDTRLGTIARINPEAAERLVQMPAYYKRTQDDFHSLVGVSDADYQQKWALRDVETLESSLVTNLILTLGILTQDRAAQGVMDPVETRIEVMVNTYPYRLDPDTEKAILSAFHLYLAHETGVSSIHMSHTDLTPKFLRENTDIYITYDLGQWLRYQLILETEFALPNVTVMSPAIARGDLPEINQDIREIMPEGDHFRFLTLALLPFVRLEFLPVSEFCILQHWE